MSLMGEYLVEQEKSKSTRAVEIFNNKVRTLFLENWTEEKEIEERKEVEEQKRVAAAAEEESVGPSAKAKTKKTKGGVEKPTKKGGVPVVYGDHAIWSAARCGVSRLIHATCGVSY